MNHHRPVNVVSYSIDGIGRMRHINATGSACIDIQEIVTSGVVAEELHAETQNFRNQAAHRPDTRLLVLLYLSGRWSTNSLLYMPIVGKAS